MDQTKILTKRNRSDAWKPHEIEVLVREWDKLSSTDIAVMLGRTPSATRTKAKELKIKKSKETLRMLSMRRNTGQFLSGRRPANEIPDLTVSIRTSSHGVPSKWIKLGLANWKQLHDYNWEKAGNRLPNGFVLCFKDNDPLNCEVDNLVMVKRGQHQMANHGIGAVTKQFIRQQGKEARRQARLEAKARHKAAEVRPRQEAKQSAAAVRQQAKHEARRLRRLKTDLNAKKKQLTIVKATETKTSPEGNDRSNQPLIITREKEKTAKRIADLRKIKDQDKLFADREAKRQAKAKLKAIKVRNEQKKEWEARQTFKTKTVDTSQLIPFRLDNNTVVYLKPGQDPEAVRAKYANRDTSRLYDQL